MVEKDKRQFISAFGALCEIFGKEPTEILIEGYFRALNRFQIEEIEAAISQAICTCQFFPRPVELIEIITGGSGRIEDKAMIEATKVLNAIRRIGAYESVAFDDPITQAVIRQAFGGWVKMCSELKSDQSKWFIKDFIKIYQSYANEQVKFFGHMPGIIEMQNRRKSLDYYSEPILIGDKQKAKLISETIQDENEQIFKINNSKLPLKIGE